MNSDSNGERRSQTASTDGSEPSTVVALQHELTEWIERNLRDWQKWSTPRGESIVREPIHHDVVLEPLEVTVLSMPLMQRLQHLHQAGVARFLYPGMHHTRFEHALGTLSVAQQMLDALSDREKIDPGIRLHVRLAALLHDIGMLPFSHIGELIFEDQYPSQMLQIRRDTVNGTASFFAGCTTREILSYLIVTSTAFRQSIQAHLSTSSQGARNQDLAKLDFEKVGRLIIRKTAPHEERWAADILGGSFGADQLDYVMRDSYYSGIRADIHVARLFRGLRIARTTDCDGALSLTASSALDLEAFLMARFKFAEVAYYHHKLRALECMVRGAFEEPVDSGISVPRSAHEWLSANENDLLSKRIRNGERIKTCLVLNHTTVEGDSTGPFSNLALVLQDQIAQRELRRAIYDRLPTGMQTRLADLWVDGPPPPSINRQTFSHLIQVSPEEVVRWSELSPVPELFRHRFAEMTEIRIFYSDIPEARQLVADIAAELFRKEYRLHVRPLARDIALHDIGLSV